MDHRHRDATASGSRRFWGPADGSAIFNASGFRGKFIAIDPTRDLVLVRLGESTSDQRGAVYRQLRDLIQCFPAWGSE